VCDCVCGLLVCVSVNVGCLCVCMECWYVECVFVC